MALHDQLTGLANRSLFMDRVEEALAAAERDDSDKVGLIFLDLDGFKSVNDTGGHAQGDKVLKAVAERILASIRPGDTAARVGGDEFAVLCPGVADTADLLSVGQRIRDNLRWPVGLADPAAYDQLSVSAGAVISQPGYNAETLLQRADMVMYQAKRSGKDRLTVADPQQEAAMLRTVELMRDLERALDLDQFVVHFQPIVNLRTGECVAAEALLRWMHPRCGLLRPDEFLGLAETTGRRPLSDGTFSTRPVRTLDGGPERWRTQRYTSMSPHENWKRTTSGKVSSMRSRGQVSAPNGSSWN